MTSTLILCCAVMVTAGLGYYITFGVFKLIEKLAKNTEESLKPVFIIATIIGLTYIIINRDTSEILLHKLKEKAVFWEHSLEDNGEQFNWTNSKI